MILALALLACKHDDPTGGDGGTDAATDGGTTVQTPVFDGRPVGTPTGTCPAFTEQGKQTLSSNGVEREVEAYWPEGHEGPIGLMYAWHGLGDSASNFARALDLKDYATKHDILVIVPYSENPDLLTWNYIGGGGNDLVLFRDLRDCAAQSFDLDLSRVWSMGFSFGALWTTFLTMEASDELAGTVTFSGGVGESVGMDYTSPAENIPVLVAWGGEIDTFNAVIINVDFSETSQLWADDLEADGHDIVRCDHGKGHTVPAAWDDIVANFLLNQTYGATSPYADGDVSDLPDYCY